MAPTTRNRVRFDRRSKRAVRIVLTGAYKLRLRRYGYNQTSLRGAMLDILDIELPLWLPISLSILLSMWVGGMYLRFHLDLHDRRACTGLEALQNDSSAFEKRLSQCLKEGRTFPAR